MLASFLGVFKKKKRAISGKSIPGKGNKWMSHRKYLTLLSGGGGKRWTGVMLLPAFIYFKN
jgi:hypothetical protein